MKSLKKKIKHLTLVVDNLADELYDLHREVREMSAKNEYECGNDDCCQGPQLAFPDEMFSWEPVIEEIKDWSSETPEEVEPSHGYLSEPVDTRVWVLVEPKDDFMPTNDLQMFFYFKSREEAESYQAIRGGEVIELNSY